jgi:CDP-glucose 4,6-dehydratase
MESLVTAHRMDALPNPDFWRGKRVLITGHTGFKGSWLAIWLKRLGARIAGIALSPNSAPSLFEAAAVADLMDSHLGDIRDPGALARSFADFKPEIVLHLAAQPLVRASYDDPIGTFGTNVMGTVNVLEAVRASGTVRVVVVVTTDKVYLNAEQQRAFRETDMLGGHDPYSASKAAAELAASAYRSSFLAQAGVAMATARAGNVIGGGDWAVDRLIPDAIRAWSAGATLQVRRPAAVRPWNHVLESLTGYLVLAERLWETQDFASAWNFGPPPDEAVDVRTVIEMARRIFGGGDVAWSPVEEGPHEARWLSLDNSKARQELGVRPRWNVATAVDHTIQWYRRHLDGQDARGLCEIEIGNYIGN